MNRSVRSKSLVSILGSLVFGATLAVSACGGDDGDDGGDSSNGGSTANGGTASGGTANGGTSNGGTSSAGTAGGQGLTSLRKNTAPSAK